MINTRVKALTELTTEPKFNKLVIIMVCLSHFKGPYHVCPRLPKRNTKGTLHTTENRGAVYRRSKLHREKLIISKTQ